MNIQEIMLEAVRCCIVGEVLQPDYLEQLDDAALVKLLKISQHLDISHLVAASLIKSGYSNERYSSLIQEEVDFAIFRYERLRYNCDNIEAVLEAKNIPYIMLKGASLREYYPESWMRTSCDIDILIKRDNIDEMLKHLESSEEYSVEEITHRDISVFTKDQTHIEIHYELNEELFKDYEALRNVFEHANKVDGYNCKYDIPSDIMTFYLISHTAKHFVNGGCGVRPLIDLWLVRNQIGISNQLKQLLQDSGLSTFTEQLYRLIDVWFESKEHNEVTSAMQSYIIQGGTYGTTNNMVASKGGKNKYIASRIFLPYKRLKQLYPVVEKAKILVPFYQVVRWVKIIFGGGVKRSLTELSNISNIDSSREQFVARLLEKLEL